MLKSSLPRRRFYDIRKEGSKKNTKPIRRTPICRDLLNIVLKLQQFVKKNRQGYRGQRGLDTLQGKAACHLPGERYPQ